VTRASAILLAVVAAVVLTATNAGASAPPEPPPTTPVENAFVPDEQNLGDCVSALPPPECGSDARGGWRQALILGLVVAGGAFIAWRVVRSLRRNDARGVPPRRPRADRLDR
jgi:hypothetical protein